MNRLEVCSLCIISNTTDIQRDKIFLWFFGEYFSIKFVSLKMLPTFALPKRNTGERGAGTRAISPVFYR